MFARLAASGLAAVVSAEGHGQGPGHGPGPALLLVASFLTAFSAFAWASIASQVQAGAERLRRVLSEILAATEPAGTAGSDYDPTV